MRAVAGPTHCRRLIAGAEIRFGFGDRFGQSFADLGGLGPNFGQPRPTLVELGPLLIACSHCRPALGQFQPVWSSFAICLPNLATMAQNLAHIGQLRSNLGRTAAPRATFRQPLGPPQQQTNTFCDHDVGLNRRISGGTRRSPFGGGRSLGVHARICGSGRWAPGVRDRSGPETVWGENGPRMGNL